MSPRTVRVVVLLVVLAMVLGALGVAIVGLTGGDDDPGRSEGSADARPEAAPPTPPPAGATDPPEPQLAPYYSQELSWEACGEADCATLTVPLDYADPDGATIDLALLRVPAADPDERIGSLVVNPGGPGAPGTDYAERSGDSFRDPITDVFDVVGFDPRGTGESAPVDCLSDEELDEYLASDPAPDSPEEVEELVDQVTAFGEGCVERSGELAGHVSTIEAVRDMDVLRAALGEPELLYFGASYGTQLGATYAELFPDRVGRMVLDGAVDVSLTSREKSLQQAAGFETALRAYVEDCVAGGDCFLGDSVEEGLTRITDLLDEIDAEPLPTEDGRELEIGSAFYGLITPLYGRENWPLLDAGLEGALEGDGTVLMLLADFYASRESGRYLDNSAEAIFAINCLDDPASLPAADVPGEFAAFEEASPTLGRVFAWGLVGCAGFTPRSAEPPLTIRGEGAAPIVVVGTTRDPATPYVWAEALADQLASAVLVTREGDGHTGYNAGNACVDEAIEAYLIDGIVPEDGLRC
ncbi:alpha/beta hydrolase [Nocardioides dongkuii]|uniref:alpha/beta hydrolase n=1 Tax=Nocardioides dongkuii TaxID=2760089 RepID=UPI0029D41592|nr:alpha/beta hydrolase [Nocardioides dongkuii]